MFKSQARDPGEFLHEHEDVLRATVDKDVVTTHRRSTETTDRRVRYGRRMSS